MSEINNGGPAFPMPSAIFKTAFDAIKESVPLEKQEQAGEALAASAIGMTLRDYFAAQSIAGINPGRLYKDSEIQSIANQAYKLADAMLAAREKGGAA